MCIVRPTHQQLECHHEEAVLNDKRVQLECKMDGGTDASKLPPPSPSPAS